MTSPTPPLPGEPFHGASADPDVASPEASPTFAQQAPQPLSSPPPRRRFTVREAVFAGVGLAIGAVAVGTAWTISVGWHASSEEAAAAEAAAAADAKLQPYRDAELSLASAASTCGLDDQTGVAVSAGSITFSGAGQYDAASILDVACVLTELGADSSTNSKISQTRALDGRQEDHWGVYSASWTYHPDDGLNLIVEIDDPPAS